MADFQPLGLRRRGRGARWLALVLLPAPSCDEQPAVGEQPREPADPAAAQAERRAALDASVDASPAMAGDAADCHSRRLPGCDEQAAQGRCERPSDGELSPIECFTRPDGSHRCVCPGRAAPVVSPHRDCRAAAATACSAPCESDAGRCGPTDAGGAAEPPVPFEPGHIPQIAAGEYWLPGVGVSGTSVVTWAGRNGTNALTAPAAQAPHIVWGPGGQPAWQYVAAESDVFSTSAPAGPLAATDGVYAAFWFRFDALDAVSRVLLQQHGLAGARKWDIRKTASLSTLQVEWSDDGTNLLQSAVSLTEPDGLGRLSILDKYLFAEVLIDPQGTGAAQKTRLWLNGAEQTWEVQSGTGGAALHDGGVFRIGNNDFENQDLEGQIGPVYIGRRVAGALLPTSEQRQALMRYAAPKDRRLQVILDGNSLTAGQGASVPGVTSYPGVLRASLGALGYSTRDVHDSGHGGDTTQRLVDELPALIAPFFDPLYERNALVMFEVRNSSTSGATAEQIIAQHQAYWSLARGVGFWCVVATAPPTDGDPVGQGVSGAVNAWLRENWQSLGHAFIDFELQPELSPAGNVLNPTYYSDGVHGTDAMYALLASLVQKALLEH